MTIVNARATYRNHNAPDNRNNNLGVRVVRASHIVLLLQRHSRTDVYLFDCCERATRPWPTRVTLPVLAADHGLRPEAEEKKDGAGESCPHGSPHTGPSDIYQSEASPGRLP